MSFPSLDIPGAQHVHVLTPWWLFLIYSFFHPKCWKHQIGEKGEEKIKPLQYFFKKKIPTAWSRIFQKRRIFPPQHFSCFSTRAFPSITPLIQFFFFFPLNFPHLLYGFAARPRKWLRRAVGFFSPSPHGLFLRSVIKGAKRKRCSSHNTQTCRGGNADFIPSATGGDLSNFTLPAPASSAAHSTPNSSQELPLLPHSAQISRDKWICRGLHIQPFSRVLIKCLEWQWRVVHHIQGFKGNSEGFSQPS